jgi:hypothetical protein
MVVARTPADGVLPQATDQRVITVTPIQRVGTVTAQQQVIPHAAIEGIVTPIAEQQVIPAAPTQNLAACARTGNKIILEAAGMVWVCVEQIRSAS